jgi:hypothetical protein
MNRKKLLMLAAASAMLLAPGVAAVCDGVRSGPLPPAPPEYSQGTPPTYDFDPEAAGVPLPPGFSSWTEFTEWTFDLYYYPDGTAKDQGGSVTFGEDGAPLGLNEGVPPPGILTMPDGSTTVWLGEIPDGYGYVNLPGSVAVCELAWGADDRPTGCVEGTIITEVPTQ